MSRRNARSAEKPADGIICSRGTFFFLMGERGKKVFFREILLRERRWGYNQFAPIFAVLGGVPWMPFSKTLRMEIRQWIR